MGGLLDARFFAYSWQQVKQWPRREYSPFLPDAPLTHSISFLELYTVFYAVQLWGRWLQGLDVVVRVDNTVAISSIEKWWGPAEFISPS